MARSPWIDQETHPALDVHVERLEHFTASLADGVVDAAELAKQEQLLVGAMRSVEGELSDAQHEKVTHLLAELVAYSVMRTLHEMAGARVRGAIE
jgi:hypothetical protein